MELPFELSKYHNTETKCNWKAKGLIHDDIDGLYQKYIYTKHCELCNKEFKNTKDRHMEHNHATGEFRNFVCRSCNQKKDDVKMRSNNTSGYRGLYKVIDKRCKQGFFWRFEVTIDGKHKTIKNSVDKDKLIEFADKWKIDNNYNT